jgi:ribonuclease HII
MTPQKLDLQKRSLADLRSRLPALIEEAQQAGGDALVRDWVEALASDHRAGARALGASLTRRIGARVAEAERLDALFEFRRELMGRGYRAIAGVDEVGVGPLAGPVVAGAVILPEPVHLPGLNDSKKLSPQARERLAGEIQKQAIAIGIGEVSPAEIDRMNILNSSLEAMSRAVKDLATPPDYLAVDARIIPGLTIPQTPITHGDALDGSIGAASIVAKVHRDALMVRFDTSYPGYGFAQHKGYGTAEHMGALRRLGACEIHRRSFAPVAEAASRRRA